MFTIYHSNDVSVLKTLVIELMQRNPLDNVFAKETILVQSPGMSQWLKLRIADRFGIAANIDFPLPATFVWNVFKEVLPDVPERSAFSKEQMTWRLLAIIPDYLNEPEFKVLAHYLKNDDRQVKLYQLSARIADIFDQYLMYRPHWINAWESDQSVDELAGEDQWQAILWRALTAKTLSSGASKYHRANLYDDCIARLEQGVCPASIKDLKRIFIFGISALPPRYLDVLNALGKHIDIHFMLTNPCQYYWGDILDQKYLAKVEATQRQNFHSGASQCSMKTSVSDYQLGTVGNSLLASWGKVGRDMQRLLTDYSASEIEAFVEPDFNSLLAYIKRDLLTLNDPYNAAEKQLISRDDRSVSLNVCHSAMREVEVLHDYLLQLMDQQPDIQPRDIVVMVSDIDAYSPYIHAVFSAQPQKHRIPFSISDLSSNHYHSVIQAYVWLLGTQQHRFTTTELLAFIQVPAVMNHFGITEQDLDLVTHWIQQSGVRWGLDEKTAESFELPGVHQNTWLFGLERMLAGYAMSDSLGVVDGVLPYEQIQGMNAELAGKLALLVQQLIRLRTLWNDESNTDSAKLSVSQWKDILERLKDDFFKASNEDDLRQLQQVSASIEGWYKQMSEANPDHSTQITSEVMLEVMSEKLIQERISQRFLAGQMNFCTLMPMRSVPFKVVCLLGMDGNAYPRQQVPLGFDLMQGRFEYGDRSRRDDDRFLFLEAVMSAEEHLYLSYTGRSIRDNSEVIPSILISELIDYCFEGYLLEGCESLNEEQQVEALQQHLTSVHTMTPYNPSLFDASKGLSNLSYSSLWRDIAEVSSAAMSESEVQSSETDLGEYEFTGSIDLQELKKFWSGPVHYFFHKRLKVYLSGLGDPIEEDERFELNHLQQYQLKHQLAEASLAEGQASNPMDQLLAYYQAEGSLPNKAFGSLALEDNYSIVDLLTAYLNQHFDIEVQSETTGLNAIEVSQSIVLDGKTVELEGWLPKETFQYRVGRLRTKDMFSCWIDHLSLCAQGEPRVSQFVGVNSKDMEVEHLGFNPLPQDEAKDLLSALAALWLEGMSQPLLFTLDLAQTYSDELANPKTDDQSARSKLHELLLTYMQEDEYYLRCWPQGIYVKEDYPLIDALIVVIEQVYQPMSSRLVDFLDQEASN